jgi:hypothetical protein
LVLAALLFVLMCSLMCSLGVACQWESNRGAQVRRISVAAADGVVKPVHGWSDRFGDGTPDFLRLTDPADQAGFRSWFTLIADYQAIRPKAEIPNEIMDCASLLRFSYREAMDCVYGHRCASTARGDHGLALSRYTSGYRAVPGETGRL